MNQEGVFEGYGGVTELSGGQLLERITADYHVEGLVQKESYAQKNA